MMSDFSRLMGAATLAVTTGLGATGNAESLKEPPLTADKAGELILKANRAADTWVVASLAHSFNPNSSVTIDNRQVALGLTPESCTRLKESSRFLVDLDTYKAAQDLLIQLGNLPPERAARQFRDQSEMMDVFFKSANNIIQHCKTQGIDNFHFVPSIAQQLGMKP
jgi:hypothetical protein